MCGDRCSRCGGSGEEGGGERGSDEKGDPPQFGDPELPSDGGSP
jgi:hypothetical protein